MIIHGKKGNPAEIDETSGGLITLDYAHHEIHEGDAFTQFHAAGSKNDGTSINMYFKTPDTAKRIHILMVWASTGAAYGRILEAPTVTGNTGSHVTILNHRRDSTNTSGVLDNSTAQTVNKASKDVTTSSGTTIYEEYSGAAKTSAGAGRNLAEYILNANTKYVFEVESDAASLVLSMALHWYEHTDTF